VVNSQLIEWIRTYKNAGYTIEQLQEYLIKQGYSKSVVNEAIYSYSQLENSPIQQTNAGQSNQEQYEQWQLNKKLNSQTKNLNYSSDQANQQKSQEGQFFQNDLNDKNINNYSVNNNSPKKYLKIIIIAIILFVVISGGIVYFMFGKLIFDENNVNLTNFSNNLNQSNNSISESDLNVDKSLNLPTDMSLEGNQQLNTVCVTNECFNEYFSTCKKAELTMVVEPQIVYYYEIIGPEKGMCNVKSYFASHSDSKFLGIDMTCLYDNKLLFNESIKDQSRCTGLLSDLLNKKA